MAYLAKVPVKDVLERFVTRKDYGNMEILKDSMRAHGRVLVPIILGRGCVLIKGSRRLRAARELEWESIDAIFIPTVSRTLGKSKQLSILLDLFLTAHPYSVDEQAEISAMMLHELEQERNQPAPEIEPHNLIPDGRYQRTEFESAPRTQVSRATRAQSILDKL